MGYRWYDARAPARCASRSATASPTRPSRSAPRASPRRRSRPARTLTVEVDVTNTGDRAGLRGRPALRRAAAERARPPAAGAAGLRQGPPRPRRDHHRRARAHRPRVRLLGPGRPELGVPAPARRRLPDDPLRRGPPHHGRLADRPGDVRAARRPLVGGPPPRGPAPRRLVAPEIRSQAGGASARAASESSSPPCCITRVLAGLVSCCVAPRLQDHAARRTRPRRRVDERCPPGRPCRPRSRRRCRRSSASTCSSLPIPGRRS